MSVYNFTVQKVIFPTFDLMRGTKNMKYLKILRKTQWHSPEEIKKHQQKELRRLIKTAYENVPYYHRLLRSSGLKPDDIKTIKDLEKIPPLTKKEIREHTEDLLNPELFPRTTAFYTGGTTGEPVKFYLTKDRVSWGSAADYRGMEWGGHHIGDKQVLIWGAPIDLAAHRRLSYKIKRAVARRKIFSAYDLGDDALEKIARDVLKFKPKTIKGYASALFLFARYVDSHDIKIPLKAVFSTAEKLHDFQRDFISSTFECDVFDGYGGRETSLVAYECDRHEGLHISEENVIVEVVKDGESVVEETGEIYITDLRNFSMPFIRYRVGDVSAIREELCSCGRGLSLLRGIEGRITDYLITPDGKRIHGLLFAVLTQLPEGQWMEKFQVYQSDLYHIKIFVKPKQRPTDKNLAWVKSVVQREVGESVDVEVEIVDRIPPAPSGKTQYVVSRVPPDSVGGETG